ncbi:hypothetical protein BN1723_011393 [Verticillium longisporum]|uniref:Uncharacterized protein n=1 Tax=Verticillium longisporum TaxID=100787 RepID=A0A0G4L6S7_VERLO|nr:hypothetical protein BN1723_011393 [Verticillium longisporum]
MGHHGRRPPALGAARSHEEAPFASRNGRDVLVPVWRHGAEPLRRPPLVAQHLGDGDGAPDLVLAAVPAWTRRQLLLVFRLRLRRDAAGHGPENLGVKLRLELQDRRRLGRRRLANLQRRHGHANADPGLLGLVGLIVLSVLLLCRHQYDVGPRFLVDLVRLVLHDRLGIRLVPVDAQARDAAPAPDAAPTWAEAQQRQRRHVPDAELVLGPLNRLPQHPLLAVRQHMGQHEAQAEGVGGHGPVAGVGAGG